MMAYYGTPSEHMTIQGSNNVNNNNQDTTQDIPSNKTFLDEQPTESIQLDDIKRMKSTRMNRKFNNSHRVGKRSTLMETPSPNAAFASNKSDDESRPQSVVTESSKRMSLTENGPVLLGELSQLTLSNHSYTKSVPKAKSFYFGELGALDHFMLKHIAVLYLEEILHNHFTLEELADLIDDKKNSTLWGKFVTSLKAGGNKKVPRAKGKNRKR
jgi:hypothetical protein